MRAGALRERLTIQCLAGVVTNDLGETAEQWETVKAMRGQLVEQTASESVEASGVAAVTSLVFRMRFLPGLTVAHRIVHEGRTLDVVEIKELGRRGGHEVRCTVRGLS
ncbi:head-tail adaptor protein [Methylopila sp. 73B]|uniref:head-tail adaptor protein n=1 Tax=Methylopila sp. 73B TaxID=1120792 RepID=UPI000380F16C|nr:head-tail adaptor protein [Methylopila sp. 73B]